MVPVSGLCKNDRAVLTAEQMTLHGWSTVVPV
jgi:hypothetical protein